MSVTAGMEVVRPGLDTCVQDYPGRLGHYARGFPPSGPLDSWSFRLANRAVGNRAGEAGLECQFAGPALRILQPTSLCICGADMQPRLDGELVPMWRAVDVLPGQLLELTYARRGARTYLAFAGGIDVPEVLGSRSTFAKAGVGGFEGRRLRAGDCVSFAARALGLPAREPIPERLRAPIDGRREWHIEAVAGPHDDWLDVVGLGHLFGSPWRLSAKSDRTGMRLEGPTLTFTRFACEKPPENGADPSNIIDYGYPIGGVNLGGRTPIILVNDALNMGGFICPLTVASAAFWKLAQSRPGDSLRFMQVEVAEAQRLARALDVLCDSELQ